MLRGLLERLKRKYGPLPLWAWAGIAGAAGALWWRLRGPREEEAPAISGPAFAESALAYGAEPDYGDTGTPAAVGGVEPVDATGEFYPDNKLREASMELIDQIRGISDELATTQYAPYVEGGEEVVEPDVPSSVATPAKPTQPERGVRWYGQTFGTKAAFAAELARRGYRGATNAGQAWRLWAKGHPGQAAKVPGAVPKPPKRQPAKAPKRPSARTPGREPAKGGRGAGGARARAPQKLAPKPARPRAQPKARQAPQPAPKPKPKPKRRILPRRGGAGARAQ